MNLGHRGPGTQPGHWKLQMEKMGRVKGVPSDKDVFEGGYQTAPQLYGSVSVDNLCMKEALKSWEGCGERGKSKERNL